MADDQTPQRITVLNVLAVSYSGATWANLMLGSHPACFNVGEVDRIKKMGRAICTLHGDSCPLWSRFDFQSQENPFFQISRLTGKRVLIVNNAHRLRDALFHRGIDRRYLLLLRDGRDVVASALRKHPDQGVVHYTREWAKNTRRRLRWVRRDRQSRSLAVAYERLRSHTDDVLRQCCAMLDLPFDPVMHDTNQAKPHFIGGNYGPLSVFARHHGLHQLHLQAHDRRVHTVDIDQPRHTIHDQGRQVVIDFSRYLPRADQAGEAEGADPAAARRPGPTTGLTPGQRRWFALLGGGLNRRLGYPRDRGPVEA